MLKTQTALKACLLSAIIAITYYVVFILPYSFPIKSETFSLSWALGFNNMVSIIGTVFAIALITAARMLLMPPKSSSAPNIFLTNLKTGFPDGGKKLFWLLASLYVLLTIFYTKLFAHPNFHGEDEFFIRNIDLLLMGKVPYRDFWFHFGPALIYVPAIIKKILLPFGITTKTSYYIFHGLMNLLSLFMLYYTVNRLNIEQKHRNLIFAMIALLQLNFTMGVQYTLIRVLPPFYFLFLLNDYAARSMNTRSIMKNIVLLILPILFLMTVFALFIEIGIAFFVVLTIYLSAASAATKNKKLFIVLCFFLVSVLLSSLFIPHSVFRGVLNYIGGGQNIPVFPSPPALLFIFCLLYSIPLLLTGGNSNNDKPIHISYAMLCVSMVPAAFGRFNSGHIFLYGAGIFIATAAILSRTSVKMFKAYMLVSFIILAAALSVLTYANTSGKVMTSLYSKFGKHLFSDEQIIKYAAMLGLDQYKTSVIIEYEKTAQNINYSALDRYPSLATPLMIDSDLYNYLLDSGKFAPEYYLLGININDKKELARKIEELDKNDYLIIYKRDLVSCTAKPDPQAVNRFFSLILFFPVKIPANIQPPNAAYDLVKHILSRYKKIDEFGQYYIYKKK